MSYTKSTDLCHILKRQFMQVGENYDKQVPVRDVCLNVNKNIQKKVVS